MTVDLKKLTSLAEAVSQRTIKAKQGDERSWYSIKNSSDTAEVYIYDMIGEWGVTARSFVSELRNVTAKNIDLHLNTPGGQVFDGIAIYNALRNHPASVTTYVDGLAASAGSFIAMAGEKVVMEKTAKMMIHDAQGLVIGNASDMREMADLLDELSDTIAEIYADKAGDTVKSWRKAMKSETWYNAEEAVKSGLADEVAGREEPDNKLTSSIGENTKTTVLNFDPQSFMQALKETVA